MRKVILIGEISLTNEANGVTQKCISQAKAFNNLGAEVDCIGYDGNNVVVSRYEHSHFQVITILKTVHNMRLKRFPLWFYVGKYMAKHNYDLAYIRYPIIDIAVLRSLKRIRKACKKVVIEIPSYPFEIKNAPIVRKALFGLDALLHNKCEEYVDRILYIGNKTDKIFNCPALQIPNGLPEQIKEIRCTGYHIEHNKIYLLCVSNMHSFHGYDRLLKGLIEYYKGNYPYIVDIIFVGDGSCRKEYESIVHNAGLNDHVRFTGLLKGDNLTSEYLKATVGIGSLGLYREGFAEASSLKTKEYLVRGLPFVYAVNEIGLEDSFPYALRVPNDDTPIEINKIVDFVVTLSKEESTTIGESMREYAERRFSWERILKEACGDLFL